MNKLIQATLLGSCLFAGSALATPIVIEATDVEGMAELTYGVTKGLFGYIATDDAPVFSIDLTAVTLVDNVEDYAPGDYNIDFSLAGLWFDFNEDGSYDLTPEPISFSSAGPVSLGALPSLSGTDGALSWNVDIPGSSLWVSYDFDSIFDPFTWDNKDINRSIGMADIFKTGKADGVMNTNFGWESLTLRLDPVAVPEPSLWLLGGIGLIGFGMARRRRRRIVS